MASACGSSKRHDSTPRPPGAAGDDDGSGASTATGGSTQQGGSAGSSDTGTGGTDIGDAGDGTGVTSSGGSGGDATGGFGASSSGGTGNVAGAGAQAGTAGSGASTPTDPPDRDDHTPPAFVPSCLQPTTAADAVSISSLKVGSSVVRASERDCTWGIGEPLALPVEPDDPTTLLLHFDVNGDGVDDLYYGDYSISDTPASGKPLVLFTSRIDGDELSYERTDCETPWAVSNRNYFLRDLDRDGVPDFVIGGINGVSAILNTPDDRSEVLHYDWKNTQGWASILDVAVADFDQDGRDDVAIGYDRTFDSTNVEGGVLLFRDRSASGTYGEPEVLDSGVTTFGPPVDFAHLPLGYLAAVPTSGSATALYWLVEDGTRGRQVRRYASPTPTSVPIDFDFPMFIAPMEYADGFAFGIAGRDGGLQVFDAATSSLVGGFALAGIEHPLDHERGGGLRERQFFLFDFDGDGDEDLFERDRPSWATSGELWVQTRLATSTFAPSTGLSWDDTSGRWLESPFLRAGTMPGRLLATDITPSVVPIVCSNAAVGGK